MKFTNPKIGIITDLHFGKNKEEKWFAIYDELLENIIKEYSSRGINTIFVLGDIFDGSFTKTKEKAVSFIILDYAKAWFEKLTEHFEVVLFSGNHDVHFKDKCEVSACSIFRNNPDITLVEEVTDFSFGDKNYRIVPWSCSFGGTPVDGLFCHFDIQTFKMNEFKVSDHGYSTKELFEVTDRVWSGHYHWYQSRDYQKGKKSITYMGTPLQLNWGESGKESYLHVFDLSKNEVIEKIINEFSPKHVRVSASKMDSKNLENNFVEVVWDTEKTAKEEARVREILKEEVSQSVRFNVQKNKGLDVDFSKIAASMDVFAILEEYVEQIKENKLWKKIQERSESILNRVK